MGLNVNDKNEVVIDISDLLGAALNVSNLNVTIPTPINLNALERAIPNLNLTWLKRLNITLPQSSILGK